MLWDWMRSRSRRAAPLVFVAMSLLGVSACRSPEPPPPPATDSVLGWLHTQGSQILDENGRVRRVRAVSWFGLETETCAPHGLDRLSVDEAVAAMSQMGFNTIRLPYSSQCLHDGRAAGVDPGRNPALVGAAALPVLDAVVAAARNHKMSVLLDRHRLGSTAQSELWYDDRYPESSWIEDWTALAAHYVDEPTVIGADLQNEPRGSACWGCDDPARDWAAAATRAGNAVLEANPRWLVLVEGVEQQASGPPSWWGGGLADVRQHPLSLTRPDRLVYAPHAYPPSVFDQPSFHEGDYPANLPARWDTDWGYLQREGLAPVLLGEFGSKLKTKADRQWMTTMVDHLNELGMSYGYWALNPDSSDTGGLLEDDWTSAENDTLTALAPLFTEVSGNPPPVPPSTPAPSPSTSDAPTPSATTASPTPVPSPSSSAPAAPPSATATTTTGDPRLAVRWQLQSSWAQGYTVNLTLSASRAAASGWTVRWPDPAATAVTNAWGMTCRLDSGDVVCRSQDWGGRVPVGGTTSVGVQLAASGTAPTKPAVRVSEVR